MNSEGGDLKAASPGHCATLHSEVGTHRPSISGKGCGTVNDLANDTIKNAATLRHIMCMIWEARFILYWTEGTGPEDDGDVWQVTKLLNGRSCYGSLPCGFLIGSRHEAAFL